MKIRGLSLLAIAISPTLAVAAPVSFQDKSEEVGLTGYTESWGMLWTDVNADGWPDLFLQGHRDYPRIYRNTGVGTFDDVANEYDPNGLWMYKTYEDKHGATSADVDNDGDLDVFITVSASGPGEMLLNQANTGGKFSDNVAVAAGIDYDATGRTAIWFDVNNDGLLDVHQHHSGGSYLRKRNSSGFTFSIENNNRCSGHQDYGVLTDVDNDGHLDYVCGQQGDFPSAIYDYERRGTLSTFYTLTHLVPSVSNVIDTITGDFNGDLKSDFILMRGALRPSGAAKVDNYGIDGWLVRSEFVGYEFTALGSVTFTVDHDPMGIYSDSLVQTLSTSGPTSANMGGVQISYSSSTGKWKVVRGDAVQAYIRARAVNPVGEPVMINLEDSELPTPVFHLVNGNSGYSIDYSTGISNAQSCVSGAAADFDNDMDLDVYMVCRQGVNNLANRYFDNQGNGTFVEVVSHGAEGPVGVGIEFGISDSVVVADYDVDGFMDIASTNGLLYYPVGKGGPDKLFRNNGNGNHWLEIDLSGVYSNRDGIGAKVFVTAGGVTQLREQNGGYHRWSQNFQRLHFGLASNTTANITIEWPSGRTDVYSNVTADKLYVAKESSGITQRILGPEVHTALASGDECGEPRYEKTYGPGITMWKECGNGDDWRVRFNSGLEDEVPLASAGSILGDNVFSYANPVSTDSGDLFSLNGNLLTFDMSVLNGTAAKKGINMNTGSQTTSCMDLTTMDIPRIIVGAKQKRVNAPFDLVALGACEQSGGSGGGGGGGTGTEACFEPAYDRTSEKGVFIWKACDGTEAWKMRVTAGGDSAGVDYSGTIDSAGGLSYSGFSIEGNDTLDGSNPQSLAFLLRVWNNAEDGIDFVPSANACLNVSNTASAPIYMGQNRVPVTSSLNLTTLESCSTPPPATAQCGEPSYNNQTEPGFYAWQDCDATGSDDVWHFRAVGGGLSWAPYVGALSSSNPVSATGNSLESNDTLDAVGGDNGLDFTLYVGGGGVDGIDLQFPATSATCLNMSSLPAGSAVRVGAGKQVMTGAFNLNDLGACP